MARATGIGGVFFRARDPAALAAWYRRHLGIDAGHEAVWDQAAGPTVFAPFRQDSDYFAADRAFMLNLRVDDLAALAAALRAAGIAVETRADWDGDGSYGRFARIHDPEGNPVELWQPPGG
jgi:catechol 2,3-dioxygenase-like lactoylglutathione lyase family enzyme